MPRFVEISLGAVLIRAIVIVVAIYTAVSAAVALLVYNNALQTELTATQAAGGVRLNEASSRLRAQLDVYRVLVNIIAQDRRMGAALADGTGATFDDALKDFSLTFGAWEVDLVDRDGRIQASSHPNRDGSFVSKGLMTAALNHRLGYELAYNEGQRLALFSKGVRARDGNFFGGIVVSTDLAELEFEWPVTPEPIVFFNETGLSVSSNRPELLFLSIGGDPNDHTFPLSARQETVGFDLWTFNSNTEIPTEVMLLKREIPQLNLEGHVLLDTSVARSTAMLRMLLSLTVMGALGLLGAVMVQQRRRISLETQHSTTLETRVEARTTELRAAQDELVEASKLAALGRLSAGMSHELNQPLAAILNFAENGKKLLEKARPKDASENLHQISNQVRRINQIIRNLRAFARQEVARTDVVDLSDITVKSLDLAADDLTRAGVSVISDLPATSVYALGGRVRLEQVVLNLISNAIDAMQHVEHKQLTVSLTANNNQVRLLIGDTGSGITDLDRVFEPFYTTKELGASKGMGMGLALSYGIVTRFGGQLSCANTDAGAEFTMTLPLSETAA